MRAWWLLVVVGCYDPKAQSGAPCGPDDACPAGLICDQGRCVDAAGDAGDESGGDVAPVTCNGIAEGAPCDDRNICTATSTCQGGICGGAQPSCTVADSLPDFSATQGSGGWRYGMWAAGADSDGTYGYTTDFVDAAYDPIEDAWKTVDYATNFSWAYTGDTGGHADDSPRMIPIRRWISDVQGPARLRVSHRMRDSGSGDGTRALVFLDGVEVWRHDVTGTDTIGVTEDVDVELQIGTKVDFLLEPHTTDGQDTTRHSMTVLSR